MVNFLFKKKNHVIQLLRIFPGFPVFQRMNCSLLSSANCILAWLMPISPASPPTACFLDSRLLWSQGFPWSLSEKCTDAPLLMHLFLPASRSCGPPVLLFAEAFPVPSLATLSIFSLFSFDSLDLEMRFLTIFYEFCLLPCLLSLIVGL